MKIKRKTNGSSLVVVIILTFALSIIVASLLDTLISDKRLNRRISLGAEARSAAEGAVEVAAAEVDRRAGSYSSLTSGSMTDYSLPSDMRTYLATGKVESTSIEFVIGNLSPLPEDPVTIDASDPFNAPDIDKGKPVILRHAYIFGKASATDPITNQTATSYISNLIQIREQTWLNYAIFFNLDLELHSGSNMDIDGPVHSNQTIYATAGSGDHLRFWGPLTTPQKIIRGYKYGGISVSHTGDVYMTSAPNPTSGDLKTMSFTQDSSLETFETFAENRWNGFVQDHHHGVPLFNPPGLLEYVPDDNTTSSVDETRNNAYAMIEPQLADVSSDNLATHTYAGYKGEDVENQKFSALAGLTIRVKPESAWNPNPATDDTTDPGFELVYYLGENPSRPVNRANLPQRDTATKQPIEYEVDLARMHPDLLEKLNRAVKIVRYDETGSGSAGNRTLQGYNTDPYGGTDTRYGIYDRRQGYQGSSNNQGLKGAHHTIQIDMDAFNTFLNAPSSEWIDQIDASQKVYDPDVSYSGVVYVQFPLIPSSDSEVNARLSTDKIRPAVRPMTSSAGYALVVRDAEALPGLPDNPSLRDDGLTVATNGPLYIMGNYNADGLSSTGSSSEPDTTNPLTNTEVPALLAADSVTLLSSTYTDSDMRDSATYLNNADFTEIATGIIAGIVPTELDSSGNGSNNQWAGGVHNFVRFLENWGYGSDTYRGRGSVVSLFENEVHRGPWYQSYYSYWYRYPTRDIGYHVYFAGGNFPPGLPVMRTVRRISVDDITATEYAAGPPTPPVAAE